MQSLWNKLKPKGRPSNARMAPTVPAARPEDTPGNWEFLQYLEGEVADEAFVSALNQTKEREQRRAQKARSRAVLHGGDHPGGMSKSAGDPDYVMVDRQKAKDQVIRVPPSVSITEDLTGKAIRLVLAIVLSSTSSGNYLVTQGAPPVGESTRSESGDYVLLDPEDMTEPLD